MFPDLIRDEVFRIETRRLWLRWPRPADAPALQTIVTPAEVAEMTASWPHPLPDGEAAHRIARMRQTNAGGKGLVLALAPKAEPPRLIGLLGVHATAEGHLGLGYLLGVPYHGRGLMTEAVHGLTSAVFAYTGYERIRASSRIINPASRRVLDKCGFAHLGRTHQDSVARGGPIEVDQFELTRAAWRCRFGKGRGWTAAGQHEAHVS
jgi:RimJ/RimL family protein N-acetyltransferase